MTPWMIIFLFIFSKEFICSYAEIRVLSSRKSLFKSKEPNAEHEETTPEYWNKIAQDFLQNAKSRKPITSIAKNVILFLGDGMSSPTIAAARIYEGGESNELSFERFPHTAVSKTYLVDRQVSESTATATAYLCGVKANFYTSGLSPAVKVGDCDGSQLPENQLSSIADWSQKKGKWTGFVTTTRVTHASPAGLYSHTAHKKWESDADVDSSKKKCPDVGHQLIYNKVGQAFHVILGCGRNKFLPKDVIDEEGEPGHRNDKKNLIEEWKLLKKKENLSHEYVWNREQLLQVKNSTDYLFGLFDNDMCKYNVERDAEQDPSLEEMTEAAIKKLSKSPKGFFLFVEGGMIDQAHHNNWAGKALNETVEFSKAIQKAIEMTDETDTLIVVTADHSHTMSISGYPLRNANILGIHNFFPGVKRNYPTISYANGPGHRSNDHMYENDVFDVNYQYPGTYNSTQETHGGDDVMIYAKGPWSHLFTGVMEQNTIPHLLAYASCVGDKSTACEDGFNDEKSFGVSNHLSRFFYICLISLLLLR